MARCGREEKKREILGSKKRARKKEKEKGTKWPAVAGKRTPVTVAET